MSVRLYMDHHVPQAVIDGCRINGLNLLTAFEDAAHRRPDRWLLDRATTLGRVMVTQDEDFLVEAAQRLKADIHFGGIIYAHAFLAHDRRVHFPTSAAVRGL